MGFGLIVLLPFIYLSAVPGYSSMVSHLHRLVLNPVLMMLLIPALWHQRRTESTDKRRDSFRFRGRYFFTTAAKCFLSKWVDFCGKNAVAKQTS